MAHIKAVLDQETWVEVDVPDEFQAILNSLFCFDSNGNADDGQGKVATRFTEVASSKDDTGLSNSQQHIARTESIEASADKSLPVVGPTENNISDVTTSPAQSNSTNNEERGRASLQTLSFRGVDYHMVNWLVFSF